MNSAAFAPVDDPFYYLHNFQVVLDWVASRHGDLLSADELGRLLDFQRLPPAARALLVRMVMRKGEYFRAGRLRYPEIGPPEPALRVLAEQGWLVSCRPANTVGAVPHHGAEPDDALTVEEVFRLYTRAELAPVFAGEGTEARLDARGRKSDWLAALRERHPQPRPLDAWDPDALLEPLYRLTVMPLCERLRLMFFGNLHQDWSEFVLTGLGTFRYETVALDESARPFRRRAEVDTWLALYHCRRRFQDGEPLADVEAALPAGDTGNPWVEERRQRLRYKLARQWERQGELERAEALYLDCDDPDARCRRLRVLERRGRYRAALALAEEAAAAPRNEAERQHLDRLRPRLHRKLGLPKPPAPARPGTEQWALTLPASAFVEGAVAEHLQRAEAGAPVFYVENTLLTGLFGLLCWEAIFAPLPGAFFHPFQSAPADLHRTDFPSRRADLFERAFAALDPGLDQDDYRRRIIDTFHAKWGLQSPFVHWGALSEALLNLALECIPARHLRLCFERLLRDLKANRAGLPDLIRFWPGERRYQMIEVKGPGDRLRDNQKRWLAFFASHGMPAVVCKVDWAATTVTS